MMVRFATTCDVMLPGPIGLDKVRCDARSDEYNGWPYCRCCLNDVCPEHYDAATLHEADVDSPETVYCDNCLADYGPEED